MSPESKKNWIVFATAYNDITKYKLLADLAVGLNLSYQTVRNKANIYRRMCEQDKSLPKLIVRASVKPKKLEKPVRTPHEHAAARADALRETLRKLVTRSKYPVVNPDAIIVDSYVSRRYSRADLDHVYAEGTPRTWLMDTLQVAPVEKSAGRKFIFTGAQNDCQIHEAFWNNLLAYADAIDAEIIVGPWTYETQWWNENNPTSRAYAQELQDYLCFGQMKIGDNFVFCGEMNTLPTASRPISDLGTYSRGRWAVFPHAKLQLKSIPSTDPGIQAHQVMTSGACTRPKVIPRKAGVKSIFHHVIGATLVEFDADGDVFCRQINADDDGTFYDLDIKVSDGEITAGHRVDAVVMGDIHVRKADPVNLKATFEGEDSVCGALRPKKVFLHDIFDNEARNHHHAGDNAYSYHIAYSKKGSVYEELKQAGEFLVSIQEKGRKLIVVDSNHDLALTRYINEGRYRNDGENIRLGLQLEDLHMAWIEKSSDACKKGLTPPTFSLLEAALRKIAGSKIKNVEWVHDGTSHVVNEIECGHHGFRGANGAKGTIAGFARMGRKMSIGDKHSPEIMDGVYCAGVMALNHGYNKGPSGWAVTHIIHYPNGKRSILTLQKGKWRAG